MKENRPFFCFIILVLAVLACLLVLPVHADQLNDSNISVGCSTWPYDGQIFTYCWAWNGEWGGISSVILAHIQSSPEWIHIDSPWEVHIDGDDDGTSTVTLISQGDDQTVWPNSVMTFWLNMDGASGNTTQGGGCALGTFATGNGNCNTVDVPTNWW